ncbi:hypothetical protein DBA26_13560, partial [Brucella canis]
MVISCSESKNGKVLLKPGHHSCLQWTIDVEQIYCFFPQCVSHWPCCDSLWRVARAGGKRDSTRLCALHAWRRGFACRLYPFSLH